MIAAGGTLGAMFPPSIVLAVYGLITQQDIGKLFIGGDAAGTARGLDVHGDDRASSARCGQASCRPHRAVRGAERFAGMREVWAPLLLFVFVIGGLYGGLFTPTEAGGMGAAARS